MQKKYVALRGVVWLVCLYHISLGVTLNCSVKCMTWVATNALGATKMPDASALFLARMLGTYLIVFGVGMGLAAWNPVKNRALLTLGAMLVILRTVQRLLQAGDLQEALGISAGSNWATITALLVFAAVLVFFRYCVYQEMHNSGTEPVA
jgi:hypothetical protein